MHKVLELVISWGKKGSLRIAIVGTVLSSLINGQRTCELRLRTPVKEPSFKTMSSWDTISWYLRFENEDYLLDYRGQVDKTENSVFTPPWTFRRERM